MSKAWPDPYGAVSVLVSGTEELSVTPTTVRMFRVGLGWSRSRLVKECWAVLAPWGGSLSVWFLRAFEDGHGDLSPQQLAALRQVMIKAGALTPVGGDLVGVLIEEPPLDR